jgi:NADPH:quinone reductase-like Zn-dependent oxidoreductase
MGVQLAKAYGAGVVATSTSGAENIAFCKSLGSVIVSVIRVLHTRGLLSGFRMLLGLLGLELSHA